MKNLKKIISLVITICFLGTNVLYAADIGTFTLAPQTNFGRLKNMEFKEAAQVEVAVREALKSAGSLSITSLRGLGEIEFTEKSIFSERVVGSVFFDQTNEGTIQGKDVSTEIDSYIIKAKAGQNIYYCLVSKGEGPNGYLVSVVSDRVLSDALEAGTVRFTHRSIDETDRNIINAYMEHEISTENNTAIDPWISEEMLEGNYVANWVEGENASFYTNAREIFYRPYYLSEMLGNLLFNLRTLGVNPDNIEKIRSTFQSKPLILIPYEDESSLPTITINGVKVRVTAHSSQFATYIFVPSGVYGEFIWCEARPISEQARYKHKFKVIRERLTHEVGAMCGLKATVKDGKAWNMLDEYLATYIASGQAVSQEIPASVKKELKDLAPVNLLELELRNDYASGDTKEGKSIFKRLMVLALVSVAVIVGMINIGNKKSTKDKVAVENGVTIIETRPTTDNVDPDDVPIAKVQRSAENFDELIYKITGQLYNTIKPWEFTSRYIMRSNRYSDGGSVYIQIKLPSGRPASIECKASWRDGGFTVSFKGSISEHIDVLVLGKNIIVREKGKREYLVFPNVGQPFVRVPVRGQSVESDAKKYVAKLMTARATVLKHDQINKLIDLTPKENRLGIGLGIGQIQGNAPVLYIGKPGGKSTYSAWDIITFAALNGKLYVLVLDGQKLEQNCGVFAAEGGRITNKMVKEESLPIAVREALKKAREAAVKPVPDDKKIISALNKQIEGLIRKLKDKDVRVRIAASDELGKLGSAAVPALIKVLNDEKSIPVRRVIIYALGASGQKEAVKSLIAVLTKSLDEKDYDSGKDHACDVLANALGELGYKEAVPVLIRALKEAEDRLVRRAAAKSLGKLRAKEAVTALIEALENEGITDLGSAAEALGNIGGEDAIKALIKELDKNILRREYALKPLTKIGEPAVPYLIEVLKNNKNIKARRAATIILGSITDNRAVPVLINELNDADESIREFAARALGGIWDDKRMILPLIKSLNDKSSSVRMTAAESLGRRGADAESALPELEKLATRARANGNIGVLNHAKYAINKIKESLKLKREKAIITPEADSNWYEDLGIPSNIRSQMDGIRASIPEIPAILHQSKLSQDELRRVDEFVEILWKKVFGSMSKEQAKKELRALAPQIPSGEEGEKLLDSLMKRAQSAVVAMSISASTAMSLPVFGVMRRVSEANIETLAREIAKEDIDVYLRESELPEDDGDARQIRSAIKAIFGDTVRTYQSVEELPRMITSPEQCKRAVVMTVGLSATEIEALKRAKANLKDVRFVNFSPTDLSNMTLEQHENYLAETIAELLIARIITQDDIEGQTFRYQVLASLLGTRIGDSEALRDCIELIANDELDVFEKLGHLANNAIPAIEVENYDNVRPTLAVLYAA